MNAARFPIVIFVSALVMSGAWIGCAPATSPPPSPTPTGTPVISDMLSPTATPVPAEVASAAGAAGRLLIRQGFLKGHADHPQRAWGTVEHLLDRDRSVELLRFSPDFRTEADSQMELVVTDGSYPSLEEISASPVLAEIIDRRGAQEHPIPSGVDFHAVVLRQVHSKEPLAIAHLLSNGECEDVPPESTVVRLGSTNIYTSCLPLDVGMEDLGLTGTPPDHLDISAYRLVVDGTVENPLSLEYQDLLDYAPHSEVALLICPHTFADVAEWTGVPLSAVIRDAKPLSGSVEAVFTGVDGYEKVLSLEELTDRRAFLAYWISGSPLPLEHGYPLRLVAPGFRGYDWVKWLVHIQVLGG